MSSRLIVVTIFFGLLFSIGNLQAQGKGRKNTTSPFVDGFDDSITPGLLCPWEQLNPCAGRKEVFVLSETKRANGNNYYYDFGYIRVSQLHKHNTEADLSNV